MKKILTTLSVSLLTVCSAMAGDIKWHAADTLPLLGKGIDPTVTAMRYQRLPDSLKTKVKRDAVYYLGTNSAGMAIRFRSNSPYINAQWKSVHKNLMDHMPATGTRGLDLYVLQPDSSWTYVNTARPNLGQHVTSTRIIGNMDPEMREYMLHLSLYDGVDSLYIGVDENSILEQPRMQVINTESPIVFYGTSILQGGCANRPGMAHTNQLRRRLNRETLNYGFSGNGQLDLEIADVLAAVPNPAMYVLDFVPNVSVEQIDTLMVPFVEIIEKAHPGIPILFPEDPRFPHTRFDHAMNHEVTSKNARVKEVFDQLAARYPNLYFLPSTDFVGHDNEAYVDGIHFTDLGFIRYSDILEPILRKIISDYQKQ
ncbi:MAG: SGNH/GDSL hydrolase family protein [Ruminococcus flavefaciens]|nr:SGNH/GDSL hydrolase family protein [Ruminococcus flavefaciens]